MSDTWQRQGERGDVPKDSDCLDVTGTDMPSNERVQHQTRCATKPGGEVLEKRTKGLHDAMTAGEYPHAKDVR
jgi:hypothetical protein